MAYNQAIAHVNNTDQLLAQQQKERNAEIEHEKQLAATHRNYAQSFDKGIAVAGKSRDIAIAFDNSFRKVNFDLEMQSIKAAHDSAVRNATQAAQGKINQTQQIVNLVTQTLDTGVQIAQNIETGRQKQIAQDAQTFSLQHGTVPLQVAAEIKQINMAAITEDKYQALLTDIAARNGTSVLALERYMQLSPQVQTAVAHLSLTDELSRVHLLAWDDTASKLDGRNYQEWRNSGLPEAPAAIGRLLDQKHAQIYRLFEESGNKINPQLSSSTTGTFAKIRAAETNAAMRNATQTVEANYKVREEQNLANQINTIGIEGIGQTWVNSPASGQQKVELIRRDLETALRLAKSGYIGLEEINDFANLRGPGGVTLSKHSAFKGQIRDMYAAWNANKVVSNQTTALQLKEKRTATFQMLNGLINSNEVIPMAQIESIKEGLIQEKLLDESNAALLDILAKRLDESAAAETARNVLLAAEGSGIVDRGALKRATAGNMEAYINASNEAAKQLNKNQHWRLAKDNNESLVRRIGKFGDKDVTSSSEFNNAVDTLNKIWYDDVVRYAAEPGKGMQYAYDQANANFKSLETAAEADPFGNHILKLNDLAKNPKGGIFVKDFGVTDDIQPTRAISYTQLSGTFKSLGIDTNAKGYDRSAARKILIDNPDAFDYIETDVITDFINKMQLPNQAPSYASISLFDKVAVKAGYTNGYTAAKDMLKSRGITLEANPADAITEQLFKQYGLIRVQQMGGIGNAYDLSQGRTLVRGEPHSNLTSTWGQGVVATYGPTELTGDWVSLADHSGDNAHLDLKFETPEQNQWMYDYLKLNGIVTTEVKGRGAGVTVAHSTDGPYTHAGGHGMDVPMDGRNGLKLGPVGTAEDRAFLSRVQSLVKRGSELYHQGLSPQTAHTGVYGNFMQSNANYRNTQQPQAANEDDPEISGQVMETRGGIKYWWAGEPPEFYVKKPGGKPEKKPAHHFELYAGDTE